MRKPLIAAAAAVLAAAGCDFISKAQGVAQAMEEVSKHLEADLKEPLTDAKIDQVLKITPELMAYSEEAEVKWQVDPDSGDVQQLTNMMGAVSEYMAFFEARDTRITEYWVDMMKIADARSQLAWEEARVEARAKIEEEKETIEAKRAAGELTDEQADTRLRQQEIALERLEEIELQREQARTNQQGGYTLSEEELALVEARRDEIEAVFREAGYLKDDQDPDPEALADPEQPIEAADAPADPAAQEPQ